MDIYTILSLFLISTSSIAQNHEVVQVLQPQQFYLNGGNRAMMGGKSRVAIAVTLPQNTVEWYYTFSAFHSPEQAAQASQQYSLFSNLVNTLDQVGIASLSTKLMRPTGAEVCDVFLLPENERLHFINKDDNSLLGSGSGFRWYDIASRQNFVSGVVPVKQANLQEGIFYLGIRNPSAMSGIYINIEVNAVVRKEQENVASGFSISNDTNVPVVVQYSTNGISWQQMSLVSSAMYADNYIKIPLSIRINSLCKGLITYNIQRAGKYTIRYSQGCLEILAL
ncbi:hypothetical protein J2I47_08565 [Fibrella sp. HMF5335]|uniref:Uncharacterized protein n=1 Tax=Fibrella rubiginis TaxID=2817060 RepID=A0A939K0Y6_9BACT|nr:hypothetical protein [Fibrella rubiginis]MBO0936592.1 hypothetical protein [Fibrella rubiginis]